MAANVEQEQTGATAEQKPAGQRTILLAVDQSEGSELAVKFYVNTLHREGNQVVLLHIVELPDANDMQEMRQWYITPHKLVELWKEQGDAAKSLELKYKQMLQGSGVENVHCKIEGGLKAGQVIVQAAQEEQADLVVMGTRGMGKFRRTLLGSVSDHVIHHAHCPVVVCRTGGS